MKDTKSSAEFDRDVEKELRLKETAGVLAFFMSVQFSKYLFDTYMHSYQKLIKDKSV